MPQKESILNSIKEFNRANGKDIASPLLITEDAITLEFQPQCSCKWGLLGAVYELKEGIEAKIGKLLSINTVKRIDGKGYSVTLFMKEREILRH